MDPVNVSSQVLPVSHLVHEQDHTQQSSNMVALPQRPDQANHAGAVIAKIEAIFESMLEALSSNADQLSVPYRSRTAERRSAVRRVGVITFPGRTLQEARKFGRFSTIVNLPATSCCSDASYFSPCLAQLLRIIQISREALVSGFLVTKRLVILFLDAATTCLNRPRNIFYQDKKLFGNQQMVDTLVDDLAYTFGVGRESLNVVRRHATPALSLFA